jgi:HAD superfamily hydrolase (TIGR01509 family)
MLKAIVLDFNGVIADDEPVHCRLLREIIAPYGLHISEKDYYERFIVFRDEQAIQNALKEAGRDPSREEISRLVSEKQRRYMTEAVSEIRVFPGVHEFIVSAAGVCPLAIASAAARHEIEAVLSHLGLSAYISHVVAAEDVARGKPAPDVYLAAIQRLRTTVSGIEPSQTIAIEDTPGGVASARGAGLRVAAVLNSVSEEALSEADIVLEGLGGDALDRIKALFGN